MCHIQGALSRIAIATSALGILVGTAQAVDGVLEINQACAENSGCFAGDGPGFPVEITQPGSYTLTGNLDLGSESVPLDATGVLVTADFVSIDLNGFAIIGPLACSGGPPGASGTGDGIHATVRHVRVRDGAVSGVGRDALRLGPDATVDAVTITCCGGNGVDTGDRARISGSHITRCGGFGLALGPGSAYGGNLLADNAGGTAVGSQLVELSTNACDGGTFCHLDPVGTYASTNAAYSCAGGFVSYNVNAWTFVDLGGGALEVTGDGLSPVLTGSLPPGSTTFSVSETLPGTCTESYTLQGTFLDGDSWTGTFDVTFTGGATNCFDCLDRSHPITATRQ